MRKKIIAVLLACMMAASVVPMSVSADGDGTGSTTVVTQGTVRSVTDQSGLQTAINNANEGDTIKLQGDITLTSTLTINKKVTIDGDSKYKLVSGFESLPDQDFEQNLVTFSTGSAGSVLKNVTIKTNQYNRNALNIWCTDGTVTIENVAIDHSSSNSNGGAPLIVGSSSVKVVGNLTLTTGTNSWYGINIDNSYGAAALDFSGCTNENLFATIQKTPILLDKAQNGGTMTVTGADKVGLEASISANVTQLNVTKDIGIYFTSLETAVAAMKNPTGFTINGTVDIELCDDVTVTNELSFDKPVNFDGNGHTLTADFTPNGEKGTNLVTFTAGSNSSVVKDITLVSDDNTRNVLNIWQDGNAQFNVQLNGKVVLDHTLTTESWGGAPLVVTSSNVTVNGNLEMITGSNSWYGFNVDSASYGNNATVTFSKSSTVTYTDNSKKNLPLAGLDLMDDQLTDTAVSDPANKVLAARFVAADGQVQLFDNLQDAVTAAEANAETSGSKVTITVLRSNEEATFNYEGDVKFELAKGVESPVLTDKESGTEYEVGTDGNVVPAEDTEEPDVEEPVEEIYTVTVDGKVWDEYEEGDTVSLYAPLYTYDGRRFVKWVVTSNNIVLENAYSNQITFKMPAGNVSVYPYYTYISYTPVVPDVPDYTPVKPVEPDEPEIEWIQKDGNTYLYIDDEMITGWYQDEETEKWYWFDEETGVMSDDCWEKIDGVWYLFDEDGIMLTGWQKVDGKWYYLKPWGGMATGWQLIDSVWYYLRGDGSMAANAWVQSGGYWYYLTGSGEMATNKWVEWKGDWYYLYSSGIMATNTTIDGCYIDSNGIWRA